MNISNSLNSANKILSTHPLFQSSDEIDEVRSKVGQVFRPHKLNVLGKEKHLTAQMNHLALTNTSLNTLTYGAEVNIQSDPFENFLLMMIPINSSMKITCGDDSIHANSRLAAIINPTSTILMQWTEACNQLIIRINKDVLESSCESLLGFPVNRPIEFSLGMSMEKSKGSMCRNIITLLLTNSLIPNSSTRFPLILKQTEELLVNYLLTDHHHQFLEKILYPSRIITPHYVKKSEEFMEAHAASPITMKDVAIYSGISLRTLHASFQKYRGITPNAFLINQRLSSVHNELVAARLEGRRETVTHVALSWGFTHLSHFTKSYYAKFKELPSETLKG